VTPSSLTIESGGTFSFVATGGSGTGYSWEVSSNESGGSIDDTGVYFAGATFNVTDTVTVTDSAANTANATIFVVQILALMPATSSAAPLQQLAAFTTVGGSGSATLALTTNNSGATFLSGVYTAGPLGQTTDVITATDAIGDTAIATITVGAGVSLTPAVSNEPVGGATITFAAAGGSGTGYVYSLLHNNSGASMDGAVYSPGTTFNVTDTVQVVDSYSNVGTATVNVLSDLEISPASIQVGPSDMVALSLENEQGTITWTAVSPSGGSLSDTSSSGATYTVGTVADTTDTVTATDSATGFTATASINVVSLTITPSGVTVVAGGSVTFAASGGSGAGYVFSLASSNSGSPSISSSGMYVAGAVSEVVDTVEVTDSIGNTAEATVAVADPLTVTPATVQVIIGQEQAFAYTGGVGAVTWTVSGNNSGGSIDPESGVYTAGATPDVTDTITATDAEQNVATASVSVFSVAEGASNSVAVLPSSASVRPNASQEFTTTGFVGAVTWSAQAGGVGGTITPRRGLHRRDDQPELQHDGFVLP
jgi:hypothetical protein